MYTGDKVGCAKKCRGVLGLEFASIWCCLVDDFTWPDDAGVLFTETDELSLTVKYEEDDEDSPLGQLGIARIMMLSWRTLA